MEGRALAVRLPGKHYVTVTAGLHFYRRVIHKWQAR